MKILLEAANGEAQDEDNEATAEQVEEGEDQELVEASPNEEEGLPNDEEEEADVEEDPVDLVGVAIRGLDLVTDTTASSHTLVQVEHEALQPSNRFH